MTATPAARSTGRTGARRTLQKGRPMLEQELETYEKNQESLILRSENRYALIHGDQILEIFDSHMDAISHGYLVLGNVPFLVRRITRNDRPAESFSGSEEGHLADL